MRPIKHSKGGLVAASANNICLAQQPTAAAGFTLNGALVVGGVAILDTARRILFTTTENDSAKTFTVHGTNSQGIPITESLAGPNSTTGYTTLDFKTVTSITTNSDVTANLTVGTNGIASSAPLPLDKYARPQISIQVDVSGTVNYTVQQTDDDIFDPTATINWFDCSDPNVVGQTAGAQGFLTNVPSALRLLINSGTGTAVITIIQPGIIG